MKKIGLLTSGEDCQALNLYIIVAECVGIC